MLKSMVKTKAVSLRTALQVGLLLFNAIPYGCSSDSVGNQSTKFASASQGGSINAKQIMAQIQTLKRPENKDIFEQAYKLTLQEYFAKIYQVTNNNPLDAGGYTFSNIHDQMKVQESDLQVLSDKYNSLGEYMQGMSISSLSDVPPEAIQKALALLDDVMNQGKLAAQAGKKKLNSTPAGGDDLANGTLSLVDVTSDTEIGSGLNLTASEGCAGASISLAASAGGAAASCIGSLGFGCAFSVMGVAASSVNTNNSCKNLNSNSSTSSDPLSSDGPSACTADSINPKCK